MSFKLPTKNYTKHINLKLKLPLIFSVNFTNLPHPSDGIKTYLPKVDDKTEWIDPNITEYFQIRKRVRMESEKHIKDSFLRAIETRFRIHLEQEPFQRGESAKDEFFRKETFGEDHLGNVKSFRKVRRVSYPLLGRDDPEVPLKIRNQIKHLIPYIGVDSIDDFLYEVKSASIASVFRDKNRQEEHNHRLISEQKPLYTQFNNDCLKLIEETSKMRNNITKDPRKLFDTFTQEALIKWHALKIDFSSSDESQGKLAENGNELLATNNPISTSNKSQFIEDVKAECVKKNDTNTDIKYERVRKKVFDETKNLSKANFTLSEALNLLSDDSIMVLIEDMGVALKEAHSLLMHKLDKDAETMSNQIIQKNLKSIFYSNEKEIYLQRLKMNRCYDLGVNIRSQLRDENATKQQRLTRSLYEKLKTNLFDEKKKYIKLVPFRREDYPYLELLGQIDVYTLSHHEACLDRESKQGQAEERTVVLKTKIGHLSFKDAIKTLFPKLITREKEELIVTTKSFSTKEQNKRKAFSDLSRIIYEATIFDKLKTAQNWEKYNQKYSEMLENNEIQKYIDREPKHIRDRLGSEWQKAAENNKRRLYGFFEDVFSQLNTMQPHFQTEADFVRWGAAANGERFEGILSKFIAKKISEKVTI